MDPDRLKQEFIKDFGVGYQVFGMSRLMGHIVGLLLCEDEPQSLTDITERLSVSKGPVSQITRRLSDKDLVHKAYIQGSRRDHYQAEEDIFGQAYANHATKQTQNLQLARKYQQMIAEAPDEVPAYFRHRVDEMARFYELMLQHQDAFKAEWAQVRQELAVSAPTAEQGETS